MVSTRPPTSKSSRLFNNPLVTVPKAPITIGIIFTLIFYSYFQFSSKVEVLISLFTFFQFYSVVSRVSKVDNFADFHFFYYYKVSLLLLFTPLEFFTSVLADGFSLEFEWQQVSSSLQDSSQYSGRPQQCCRLDSLHPSANFQVLQAL